MVHLSCRFLGHFEITARDTPVTGFHSDKARALLLYLALEPQQHLRRSLATLLWPEITDKHALANLRNTLHRLRQTLHAALAEEADGLLTVTRQTIQFNASQAHVDVLEFQAQLDAARGDGALSTVSEPAALNHLSIASDLYQGELAAGFAVADASTFEEWLLLRREMLQQRALMALHTLATGYERVGDYPRAYTAATRLLTLDPYREETYRQTMRLLAYLDQPDQAVRQFEQMRQVLQTELGAGPSPQSSELARQIAAGELTPSVAAGAPVRSLPQNTAADPTAPVAAPADILPLDFSPVPDPGPFFGRGWERRQIRKWLVHDRCRLVTIVGLGGMGKTSLAAQVVREVATDPDNRPFDVVLWRTLLNAPPLDKLLPPLIQILSDQQIADVSPQIDEQLALLLGYLRDRRVLLVLDNLESILHEVQAGDYRAGYEPYGQLLQLLATHRHQSHLLLTSRERPRALNRLEGDSPLVRSLSLEGLDEDAGRALLGQRGVHGVETAEAQLIARYSGNPLALKLVADTVDELFGGDITEFLSEESLVFDDIRKVLDQQFARLSALEQEILFWLAVEREEISVPGLRKNLLKTPMQSDLIEALRGLQRRSLIERQRAGFALQNVVTEYLTDRLVQAAATELEQAKIDLLHRLPLSKAQANEHVRQSQVRMLVAPVANTLLAHLTRGGIDQHLAALAESLRQPDIRLPSYAGGNLLTLWLYLSSTQQRAPHPDQHHKPCPISFFALNIRQAQLQGALLPGVDFSYAHFTECTFTSNFGRVKSLAISPDGRLLALGTDDDEIRLWRLADGQQVGRLRSQHGLVRSLAFSLDSRRLASSSGLDGAICLWDLENEALQTTLMGHRGGVEVLTFHPQGNLLASGGHDGSIRLWDPQTGRLRLALDAHTDWVTVLDFSASGNLMVSAAIGQSSCSLWQHIAPGGALHYQQIGTLHGHDDEVRAAQFSPDGSLLATASVDHTIRLWEPRSQVLVRILRGHRKSIRALAFRADGAYLASAGEDFGVRMWDVASGQLLDTLRGHDHHLWALAINHDGKTMASGGSDGTVRLWNLRDPRRAYPIRTLHGNVQPIYTLALSPQGDLFATGEDQGRIRLWQWDAATEEVHSLAILSGHDSLVDALAFSPDGRWLASGGHDQSCLLWNVDTGECIDRLNTPAREGVNLAIHPDGRHIFCGFSDEIQCWELATPGQSRLISVLHGHTDDLRPLVVSPDGRWLASSSTDDTVRLWEITTGRCLHVFPGISSPWSVVFSPDGSQLACGSRNGIHLWDLRHEEREPIIFPAMEAVTNIRPVSFSPNGKRLVSGGIDRCVRVWDLASGTEIAALSGHTSDVTDAYFWGPNNRLISSGYDGTIRIWQMGQPGAGEADHQVVRIPGPYEGMNITGATGLTDAQRATLTALGAIDNDP